MVRSTLALISQSFDKLSEKIRRRYILWKHGQHGLEIYLRKTDPDIFWPATRIKDFYHGYPHVYCIEDHNHHVYYWDLPIDGSYQIHQWCKENCEDKFRFDYQRVAKTYCGEWEVDEIGGADYIFAAFKSEQDFLLFTLKWT